MLSDKENYESFLRLCRERFEVFLQKDQAYVVGKLLNKLERGAIEHGAPVYPVETVDGEIEMEFLDILGWSLVRKFNEKS